MRHALIRVNQIPQTEQSPLNSSGRRSWSCF
jgi:hypothetical protein